MKRLVRWMVLAILTCPVLAGAGFVLGDEAGDPGEHDRSPVILVIEPTEELGDGIGTQGKIHLRLTARLDTPSLLLSIQAAGEIELPRPAEWELTAISDAQIANLRAREQFVLRLDGLRGGDVRVIPLPVSFPRAGYGYLLANVRAPAEGEPLHLSESFILYTLTSSDQVFFSQRSILALREAQLRAEAAARGERMEPNDEEILELKRGGARIEKSERPPMQEPSPAPGETVTPPAPVATALAVESVPTVLPAPEPEPTPNPDSVRVTGRIQFTDILGQAHPVRSAVVEIWDEEPGRDKIITSTTTDRNGDYSVTIDNDDGDGTGRDLYVAARAEGETVRVVEFNHPDRVWSIDSLPEREDTPGGTLLTINLTASNDLSIHPNNVAFEAYEAANALSRYLLRLGEPLPPPVTIYYPAASDDSWYQSSTIALAGTDVHDWDNIQHEYGHHIQTLYDLYGGEGARHYLGDNLCIVLEGKKKGLLLAWGEAWPTFFAILAQKEMNLASMGIPNLGDTRYTDTKPGGRDLKYDIERADGTLHGEGDELSIQQALWDLYDSTDDPGDTGVTLSARTLWDVVKGARAQTLSEFNRTLIKGRPETEKMAFGAIYARHKIGPELIAPDDASAFPITSVSEFEWAGNLGCDQDGLGRFSVRFYDETGKELLLESSWQEGSKFTLDQVQTTRFKDVPGARWVVASKGLGDPETGIYFGQSRTFHPKLGEPQLEPQSATPAGENPPRVLDLFWFGWVTH